MGGLKQGVKSLFGLTKTESASDPLTEHYNSLESIYLNSGVYDDLAAEAKTAGRSDLVPLKALRNMAPRVVDFYAAKLDPADWLDEGTIEFSEDAKANADAILEAIESAWKWSNWEQEGQVAVRQYAWAGDLFRKVSTREDRSGVITAVFFERLDPRHVRDFDKDERGFFTYLKVQTPKERRVEGDAGEFEPYTLTEIWDKERGDYRAYEHTKDDFDEEDLVERTLLSAEPIVGENGERLDTGYDFIPVVHDKFRDVGRERGLPCFGHALGGLRECDRLATRLHAMLFPDTLWVLSRNGIGPDGNPLPPIQLEVDTDSSEPTDGKGWARGYGHRGYDPADNTVSVGKDKIAKLPTGGTLEPKIPDRDLSVAAAALGEQVKETERELPETAYSRLRELELSGRAIRYMMADVYDRFKEAHRNMAAGTVRLNMMALTVGQAVGLPGFEAEAIGVYGADGAAFGHTFTAPDPFPESRADKLEADGLEATMLGAYRDLGPEPYRRALIKAGWSEADAKKEADEAKVDVAPAPPAIGGTSDAGGRLTLEDTDTEEEAR